MDPDDLTNVYFESTLPETFVGPIQVTNNGRMRSLVVTQDVTAGQLLFVVPPLVDANVAEVRRICLDANTDRNIHQAAEDVLVKAMQQQQLLQQPGFKNALLACEGATSSNLECCDIRTLLGQNTDETNAHVELSEEDLCQILRRNAFGSDFPTNDRIEQIWKTSDQDYEPPRILGHFPLAAMMNHSCLGNISRVFVKNNYMVVHAKADLEAQTELVFSYLPVIEWNRRQRLQMTHQFTCACARCTLEATLSNNPLPLPHDSIAQLEDALSNMGHHRSNELKRYIRVGHLPTYLNELNAGQWPPDRMVRILQELHFCLVTCHSSSTEHLSILHLLYEVDVGKRVFWTTQLRDAIVARYGKLGGEVTNVRRLLQHTKMVLRQVNGMDKVQYKFI